MQKFVIASDLDGTIIDHTETKQRLAERFGFRLEERETASELMKKLIPQDAYREIQTLMYEEETKNSPPAPGAREVLASLQEQCGPVYILSRRARNKDEKKIKAAWEWVEKYVIPPIESERVYFVERDEQKDEIARRLSVNVYIDDRQETLDAMPSVEHRFLFDPHGSSENARYPLVRNWNEFLLVLQSMCKAR